MAPKFALVLVVCFSLLGAFAAFTGVTNYWVGADWADYNDAANWRVNDPDTGANAVPTANDMIYLNNSAIHKYDLGGQSKTVAQITYSADAGGSGATGKGTVGVTNGALTVTTKVGHLMCLDVWDGATFTLGSGITTDGFNWGQGGVDCRHKVHDGGTLNIDWLKFQAYELTVDSGGTANLNTKNVYTHPKPNNGNNSLFYVYGTLNVPNGFNFRDSWVAWAERTCYSKYTLKPSGEMTFGGGVTNRAGVVRLLFLLEGGRFNVTGNAEFANLTSFEVAENAEVEFNISDGASLTVTNATYGAGSAVTKTGTGEFILGKNPVASLVQQAGIVTLPPIGVMPTSFTMNAGTLRVEKQNAALEGFSFPSGYTLDVRARGVRVDSPVSYNGLAITLGDELSAGVVYALQSDDAAFLSYAKSAIEATSPELVVTIEGDGIKVVRMTDNTFDATASSDLTDTTAWKGGRVPTGEDVIISGAGMAQLTAASPVFKSIAIRDGATLAVSGGTLEEPVDIPPVSLMYDARLLVEGGAFAQSTNGIDCVATAEHLPVLEIATNATLTLQTPGLPMANTCSAGYSCNDYGFRLYNVNLKWYGQIRMPRERVVDPADVYLSSQALIGWAAAGDVTYIGLDCQGGTLYRKETVNNGISNFSPLMLACPAVGGTVIPVGTLLLRDYLHLGEGEFVGNGTQFGVNNPASVRIPVLVDGSTLLKGDGVNKVAGGADVTLKGPARWEYEHDFANDHNYGRTLQLRDTGMLTLEDGGYLGITPSCTSPYGLYNLGTSDGAVSLCAKDSYVGFWEWTGSGKTIAHIEDSYIMVGQLYRVKAEQGADSRWRQMPLFEGFKSIEVPEGKTMWVTATNIWRGASHWNLVHDWDRVTKFGPPITGGGNVSVTNALKGTQAKYSMTAIITNSANTATGLATAEPPSEAGAKSYLLFGDGANWAGTVVANGRVGLTNLTAEAAAPVSVTFGTLLFETNFPVRLWKSEGVTTNDVINITGGVSGSFGLVPEFMEGYEPEVGDTFTLGAYPAEAALPKLVAGHKWRLAVEERDDATALVLRYLPRGFTFTVK